MAKKGKGRMRITGYVPPKREIPKPIVQLQDTELEEGDLGLPVSTVCYVCLKRFRSDETKVFIGPDTARHGLCEPGSPAWMQSKIARNPKYQRHYKLFNGELRYGRD